MTRPADPRREMPGDPPDPDARPVDPSGGDDATPGQRTPDQLDRRMRGDPDGGRPHILPEPGDGEPTAGM